MRRAGVRPPRGLKPGHHRLFLPGNFPCGSTVKAQEKSPCFRKWAAIEPEGCTRTLQKKSRASDPARSPYAKFLRFLTHIWKKQPLRRFDLWIFGI
jgi:hypothetical protein